MEENIQLHGRLLLLRARYQFNFGISSQQLITTIFLRYPEEDSVVDTTGLFNNFYLKVH